MVDYYRREISIHALREEGDRLAVTWASVAAYFYPRPPRGGRPRQSIRCKAFREFLSTPSARRATTLLRGPDGGRCYFYPRPPRGGRPSEISSSAPYLVISIHALREEGDGVGDLCSLEGFISIHALREEGDFCLVSSLFPAVGKFLSTPSARRATGRPGQAKGDRQISIHALREEGDAAGPGRLLPHGDFYPRPPRGGRRSWTRQTACTGLFLSTPSARRATRWFRSACYQGDISIHALREEGDVGDFLTEHPNVVFLSTPSARRATAKTETKSLFSYKLYNILHEFRRALIYNGSKNDPNHAK